MLARLRISQKFVLMAVIFSIPLAVISYWMVSGVRASGTEVVHRELAGLRYHETLVQLLRDLQAHRGLATALLHGEGEFGSERAQVAAKLKEDIERVERVDREIGAQLGVREEWKKIKADLEHFLDHWQDFGRDLVDKKTALHSRLIPSWRPWVTPRTSPSIGTLLLTTCPTPRAP